MAEPPIRTAQKKPEQGYITFDNDNAAQKQRVLTSYGEGVLGQNTARGRRQRDSFVNLDTNVNARNEYTRLDYEEFRPSEAIPVRPKEIIQVCMNAYRRVGIIRNIIDLMGDFGAQGIKITHPNRNIQNFYRKWFKMVQGKERSERFLNLLYRTGNVGVYRTVGPITPSVLRKMRQTFSSEHVLKPMPDKDRLKKNEIPTGYVFLNPVMLEDMSTEADKFRGDHRFGLLLSRDVQSRLQNPKTDADRELLRVLPDGTAQAITKVKNRNMFSTGMVIPLDMFKASFYFYKKDDWTVWADPMIYSILDDVILLEKHKLADMAALDGAISNVRVWKLGNLEHRIMPEQAVFDKLSDILTNTPGAGTLDLVWGPDLELIESNTNVHQFLGQAKYEPTLTNIYAGLGIPQTLTGSSGGASGGGLTNNFMGLQTLIERLEYGRALLTAFWEQEIELIRKAQGFKAPACIKFSRTTLSDQAAEKAILRDMVDRGLISLETYHELSNIEHSTERRRLRAEKRSRDKGTLTPQGGPYFTAEKEHELTKIYAQQGAITPSEAGLELEEKDGNQKTMMEMQMEMKKAGDTNKPKDIPNKGRPKNKKDENKRKQRQGKPKTGKSLSYVTTQSAYRNIAATVTPAFLTMHGKKNLRQLTNEQVGELEAIKFAVLCNIDNSRIPEKQDIIDCFDSNPEIPEEVYDLYRFEAKRLDDPTIEDLRQLQIACYLEIFNENETT